MRLTDTEGVTVRHALDGIGYRGPETAAAFPADAYFELHIEQGPILEREAKQIGIVTGAQAQVWYDAVATGQDSHAGTTPPSARKDALVCAARIIDLVDRMMRARGEDGRGTVGQLLVSPNSRNVIPGEVRFSVEFRHPDAAEVDRLDAQFPREAGFIARDCGVKLELSKLFSIPAQPFDPACVELVRQGAAKLGYTRAGDRLRCRPRRGVCRAARADGDDLHPVQGRAVAQRGGEHRTGRGRGRRAGAVRGGAGAGEPGGVIPTAQTNDRLWSLVSSVMAGLVPIGVRISAGRNVILPRPLREGVGGGVASSKTGTI